MDRDPNKPTVPTRFPDTTPPLPSGDYSYTVELVGTIQNQLGRLTQAVETLTKELTEVRKKVDRLSHIVYAAGVVGTIIVVIVGFAANKIADAVIASIKASGH
jgi:hypothetical protein